MRLWKSNCRVGATSVHDWKADDSKISKMPLIPLKSQLFTRKLKEYKFKEPYLDCQLPTPTSLKLPLLMDNRAKWEF
jgi:hypothetical protein